MEEEELSSLKSPSQASSEYEEPGEPGVVELNRTGIVPTLAFSSVWIGSSAVLLLMIVWFYAYVEVRKHEDLATVVAVDAARLHAAEVLAPAVALVTAANVAFQGAAVNSLSDYSGIIRFLRPHFNARASVAEVELAREGDFGSVHVASVENGIELRTDRHDCILVVGRSGCTVDPLGANTSTWYKTGYGLDKDWWGVTPNSFWEGPNFMRRQPYEVVCENFCWHPTYSFIGRVAGGPPSEVNASDPSQIQATSLDATNAFHSTVGPNSSNSSDSTAASAQPTVPPALRPVLVRVAMDSSALQDVARRAEELSRGQAFLCTTEGDVVAASDMAQAFHVIPATGHLRAAKVWELTQPWASDVTAYWVKKAKEKDNGIVSAGYRLSIFPLEGPSLATRSLGENLRIVIAVRVDAFYDPVLGPLLSFYIGIGGIPAILLVLATLIAGYLQWRASRKGKSGTIAAASPTRSSTVSEKA